MLVIARRNDEAIYINNGIATAIAWPRNDNIYMAIFNSLGSNYDLWFALRTLFASDNEKGPFKLIDFLENKYKGKAALTYKGRDALRLALRVIDKKDEYTVGICGYTCYAVYKAVEDEGYKHVYLDIDESLNFSFETLKDTKKKNPQMKVLIVQNTLGFPCDMEKIAEFCRENDIILIEDLAHSIGAKYSEKTEAGSVGDFTVLSFSQDKMVYGVSGGALIIKDQKSLQYGGQAKIKNQKFKELPFSQQLRDRLYPLFTWMIRETYGFGLGKLLHVFLKEFNLLSNPMVSLESDRPSFPRTRESRSKIDPPAADDKIQSPDIYQLPNWYCRLILLQFKNLGKDLVHRRMIASIYAGHLSKDVLSSILDKQIELSSNLRFPIFVKDREGLIVFLKKEKIFVSDIWYDSPIAPKKYVQKTDYNGQCPNSEKISQKILNLPTHRNVSKKEAEYVVEKVNEWHSLRHSRAGGNPEK